MAIDLNKLSAKELYELAMRKEQEEQQHSKRQERLVELQKQRAQLISAQDAALSDIERKLSELTSQRSKLIVEHEKSMSAVGKEIGELMQQIQQMEAKPAAPAPKAATPPPPAPPSAPEPSPARAMPHVPPAPTIDESPLVLDGDAEVAAAEGATIDSKDELFEKIRELMKTRSFISHSLLKEQLKVKGCNVPNLTKLVDQLIREGKLASAGGGNYALGKRA